MPNPSDYPIVIYLLLAFLAILLLMIVFNFILVISGKTETAIYHTFDKLSAVFIRVFGTLLLFVVIWSLIAKMFNGR